MNISPFFVSAQVNGTEADYEYEEITLERVRWRAAGLFISFWIAAMLLANGPTVILTSFYEPHKRAAVHNSEYTVPEKT